MKLRATSVAPTFIIQMHECDIEDISHKGGIPLYKVNQIGNVKGEGYRRVIYIHIYIYIYIFMYICRLIEAGLPDPGS